MIVLISKVIILSVGFSANDNISAPSDAAMVKTAVAELIKMQEDDGAWPYEGVYRVRGEIPMGYRIGGTAIVCETLLAAADVKDRKAADAIERGVAFILKALDDRDMRPSRRDAYDVRIWGHSYALDLLCRLRSADRTSRRRKIIDEWVAKLVRTLADEELDGGGWNYANRRQPASFVTAPVTQALLLARSQGEAVPDALLERCRRTLTALRGRSNAFLYSGPSAAKPGRLDTPVPGAIARSPICETTLLLLGDGSTERIAASLDAFSENWDELEKRRKKSGTHAGPYAIAPYYFYYGHRYAAQAIQMLPPDMREKERRRLRELILRTRDDDGTWNDREFRRSRNFGTAMIVLALLGDAAPLPPSLKQAPQTPMKSTSRPASTTTEKP